MASGNQQLQSTTGKAVLPNMVLHVTAVHLLICTFYGPSAGPNASVRLISSLISDYAAYPSLSMLKHGRPHSCFPCLHLLPQEDLTKFMRLSTGADHTLRLVPAGAAAPPPDNSPFVSILRSSARPLSSSVSGGRGNRSSGRSSSSSSSSSGMPAAAACQQQRHASISMLVFYNTDWQQEEGGPLRLWSP